MVARKGKRLKGAAAVSIVTVGIAMGATPARGADSAIATAASTNKCHDFAAALFLKGQDLFHKKEPFLKDAGVESGFQKAGLNVGGFYRVSTGAAEIFMKNDFQDNVAGIAFCTEDANGVTRGFFPTNDTLDGSQTSFVKVDDKQAFLKIELQDVIITSTSEVDMSGKVNVSEITITKKIDVSSP
jgi:hypothetical protein